MGRKHTITGAIVLALFAGLFQPRAVAAPDREQFIRECLDAAPTSETSKFDDYTKGSYHVDKIDLVEGIEKATESKPGRLRAVIIFGPASPMWTYHVVVALAEGDSIRVNALAMPHARITGKSTRLLGKAEFEDRLSKIRESKLLTEGDPKSIEVKDPIPRDFSYDTLVAVWTNGRRSTRFGALDRLILRSDPKALEAETVIKRLNDLLEETKTTYPKADDEKKIPTDK